MTLRLERVKDAAHLTRDGSFAPAAVYAIKDGDRVIGEITYAKGNGTRAEPWRCYLRRKSGNVRLVAAGKDVDAAFGKLSDFLAHNPEWEGQAPKPVRSYKGVQFVLTCESHPEQYDVYIGGNLRGYVRLRGRRLTAEYLPRGRRGTPEVEEILRVENYEHGEADFDSETERDATLQRIATDLRERERKARREKDRAGRWQGRRTR